MGRQTYRPGMDSVDPSAYRRKISSCLHAFARMLDEQRFEFDTQQMGLEVELNLIDEDRTPSMTNGVVLEKLDDPSYTTELGQHNLEINVPPRALSGAELRSLEDDLLGSLHLANTKAQDAGARLVLIGTLPTISTAHLDAQWLSHGARYAMLDEQILASRGEE
ncbi:MAG: glutamate--cysteine ligase, partial [Sciscionella sp.]